MVYFEDCKKTSITLRKKSNLTMTKNFYLMHIYSYSLISQVCLDRWEAMLSISENKKKNPNNHWKAKG